MPSNIRGSDNFDSGLGLGVGQTWQEVTASRDTGIPYTNSTGKPIQISIRCRTNNASSFSAAYLSIDSAIVSSGGGQDADIYNTLTAIVPNGSTYQVTVYGVTAMEVWTELRGD